METKGFKVPGWFFGIGAILITACGGVSWAYGTFVTIRERDLVKSMFENRLDTIEKKQDILGEKMDRMLERQE